MQGRMKKVLKVGVVGLTLAAGVAAAHPGGMGGGPFGPGKMQKFDANQDGTLDEGERQAMVEAMKARHEERRQEMLKKYDANNNGTLDPEERKKAHEARVAERFKALDTNNDGVLDLAEFQAGGPRGFKQFQR